MEMFNDVIVILLTRFLGAVAVSNMLVASKILSTTCCEALTWWRKSLPILSDDGWTFWQEFFKQLRMPSHLNLHDHCIDIVVSRGRVPHQWIKSLLNWWLPDPSHVARNQAVLAQWRLAPRRINIILEYCENDDDGDLFHLRDTTELFLWHGAHLLRQRIHCNTEAHGSSHRDRIHFYLNTQEPSQVTCQGIAKFVAFLILDLHPRELFSLLFWWSPASDFTQMGWDSDARFICEINGSFRDGISVTGISHLWEALKQEAMCRAGMAYQVSIWADDTIEIHAASMDPDDLDENISAIFKFTTANQPSRKD